jgi:hypothetical protein
MFTVLSNQEEIKKRLILLESRSNVVVESEGEFPVITSNEQYVIIKARLNEEKEFRQYNVSVYV